jgi:ubiquinone/menaquinone biosynthesis C-methylase UbiE
MAEPETNETYSHGHHESVLRSHEWRTAENSAGYLLDRLAPGMDLLDVGCGPGTITIDLASRVAPGRVVGIDRADEVIAQANQLLGRAGTENVTFATGDVYALDFDEASFDVVHAHQVLQHLQRPVDALRELRRVLRPDGVLAVRDSDYAAFVWAPDEPLLDRWNAVYHAISARNGAEADAGRYLLGWVHEAGFTDVQAGSSTWTFAEPGRRAWWGSLWADRVELSAFAEQAVAYGLSDPGELAAIAGAWRRWAEQPDGYFAVLHGEVLARR